MKTLSLFIALLWAVLGLHAQSETFPGINLKTPDGNSVSAAKIFSREQPTLLIFWKSTSEKCCENLENIQNAWTESLAEKGVKLVAICVDCSGGWGHVKPIVMGKGWVFETYIDVNGDFKRAMNVNTIPCTILLNENLKQVCRYNGFCAGSGEMICEKVIEMMK